MPMEQPVFPAYQPGDVIRQEYEIHKILGSGGFGIVYLTYPRSTKSVFALKTFRDDFLKEELTRNRFKNEAQVWIDLDRHPFLVRAYFAEEIEGRLFIGMEYVAPNEYGLNSLEGYLQGGSISLEMCLRWALQVCYGMEHAYSKGLRCHRDLKPANIMVDRSGNVKISDFGLAGALGAPPSSGKISQAWRDSGNPLIQTARGLSFGTPAYMPPEQFVDTAQCDERSDIYSFGIVLYQIQNKGQFPFLPTLAKDGALLEQELFWSAMYQLHMKAPVPNSKSPLNRVIKKCLEKDKRKRYQSFRGLRVDIEELLDERMIKKFAPPQHKELDAWELNNKGGSLFSLGRHEEALKYFTEALSIAPWFVEVLNNKAVCLKDMGHLNEALDYFNEALDRDSRYLPALCNKASCLAHLGRFSDAIGCCDEALEIDIYCFEAWANKGSALVGLSDFSSAIECYDKALSLFKNAAQVWYKKGLCLQALGRSREAIECCSRAIEINPREKGARHTKALALSSIGDSEGAYLIVRELLRIEPDDAMAWFLKANLEEELGHKGEAAKSYRRFLALPNNENGAEIQFSQDRLRYLEGGKTESAKISVAKQKLEQIHGSLRGKAPHVKVLADLADAYRREGRWDQAMTTYRQAILITEEKYGVDFAPLAPLLNNLAHLCFELGRNEEAEKLWERAIKIVEESYGVDDRNLGFFLTNLAALRNHLGDHSGARALCERAIRIKEVAFGSHSAQLITTLKYYAEAFVGQGFTQEAKAVESRIRQIQAETGTQSVPGTEGTG